MNKEFVRKVENAPSAMSIMVRVNGQKCKEDFNKAIDSIIREFAQLFREQGLIHESYLYLMAMLIIKCLNDLYMKRCTDLSEFRQIKRNDGQTVFVGAKGDKVLSLPIAYRGEEIQQVLNHIEQKYPNLLGGAFAQIDFVELLPGSSVEKKSTLSRCWLSA